MIDTVIWNLGGISWPVAPYILPTLDTYNAERGTLVNSSSIAKIEWLGKVGLIYPSDYGYASTDSGCRGNLNNGLEISHLDVTCKNQNWMQLGTYYWTITSLVNNYSNYYVSIYGYIAPDSSYKSVVVRPSVYLKPNVKIIDGTGASNDPYILSI